MAKRKKNSTIQIIRRIVQIAAFILLPGLFISIFNAIRDIYLALIGGAFSYSLLSSQLWILVAIIPLTILMGRFFCGFFCSFGSMGDFFWFISRKLKLPRIKTGERAEELLKTIKYLILLFIIVFIWTFGMIGISSTTNPWTIFGMFASFSGLPSTSYLYSMGTVLLLLIVAGSMLVERFFCRYLCPLGALFALISRIRLFRFRKPMKTCNSCRLCSNQCAMGIPLYQSDTVKSGECIDCFACVEICPRDNVTANPAPPVAAAMAVAAMSGLYYAGNILTNDAYAAPITDNYVLESISDEGLFTDGVYNGSAAGYRGETEVEVTVENGYIKNIEIISTGDDMEFFNQAKSSIVTSILSFQSTDVDTVSGATFSSEAIINAVADALEFAGREDSREDLIITVPEISDETVNIEEIEESESTMAFTDGVYSGTGSGFSGDTNVSITVEGGKISEITVISYQDDEPYFNRAQSSVIADIIEQQNIDIDTVSGATFSSNGIIEAVADALGLEYENDNSSLEGKGFHGGHSDRQ